MLANIFNLIVGISFFMLYLGLYRLFINYYLNGETDGQTIIYNKHIFFEFIQILFWVTLIFAQFYFIEGQVWYNWIFPVVFGLIWLVRVSNIIQYRNCEISFNKDVLSFRGRDGVISSIKSPSKIAINIIEGDRISLSSGKSRDYQLQVIDKAKNELNINLSENNLADYRFQIQKDVIKLLGKEGLKGDVKTIEGLISNRNLLFILLGITIFWVIYFFINFINS
jgi:hypothetical protein